MEHITLLLGIVIVTALVFDFTNGFHDTANAMATTISTGAMRPKAAVAMSAVLNLVGAFLSVEVAKTISGGLINEDGLKTEVIFAALVGAILWNLLTWLVGLPSSSSHALFGGLIGAAVMSAGWSSVNGGTVVTKVLLPALAAPLVSRPRRDARHPADLPDQPERGREVHRQGLPRRADRLGRPGLAGARHQRRPEDDGCHHPRPGHRRCARPRLQPPMWVIVSAGVAIALGTYLGGWRIIRTMGKGLTDLTPPQGFAAQTSAATVILASSHLGFSLSTTQSCSGAVMGAGLGRKGGVVRWSTATRMFVAWGLTLPAAALVGAAAELLTKQGDWGVAATAVLLVGGSFAIWLRSRRSPVTHDNVNDVDPVQDEPSGIVTQAMASVAPPPTGAAVASEEADGSPLGSIPAQPGHSSATTEPAARLTKV